MNDSGRWLPHATADGSRTLRHPGHGESYHSRHGAVLEARHVFLGLGGVAERLARREATRVLEIGFGSGLNFLVTVEAARAAGAPLAYAAFEPDPPPASALRALAHARHLADPAPAAELIAAFEALPPREARTPGAQLELRVGGAALELRLGDAAAPGAPLEAGRYHAVYHDAFSPATQPELWSDAFLARLAAALAPGGRLATYTVRGAVRRRLAELGLVVEKRPGPPGGKREALVAVRPAETGT